MIEYTYLITYEVSGAADLALLDAVLRRSSLWAKINSNTWIVKSPLLIGVFRDMIRSTFPANVVAKLLVLDVTKDAWASYNFNLEVNDWLRNNLS